MYLDKVSIFIKGGDGGNGAVSFHTEKFVPNGGPDGGDGGKGGDVVFVASNSVNTLNEFYYKKHFRAGNGENGGGKRCYGKQGEDIVVYVPVGTIIKDAETDRIIADMFRDGERAIVLHGGKGGRGNVHFANSRRQAPHFAQDGIKCPERQITLEIKTIADVGVIGFPNVGKSTLLSVISQAKPKIANYHFTTLTPNLGVVTHKEHTFVVADIPGLIEGAAEGAGLGHSFLRHIERNRILTHVVDISGSENRDPIKDFELINKELLCYSKVMAKLPQIVVANKMDMPNAEENLVKFKAKYGKKYKIIPMTTVIHEGVNDLLDALIMELDKLPSLERTQFEPFVYEEKDNLSFKVVKHEPTVYEVVGGIVEDLARKVFFDDYESFRYFQNTLKKQGVITELKKQGMKEGDTVIVSDLEFEYVE
ncbi:MAG TPA: GTPase ObgE [Clostridia bacterium]|nr:GTPase ObgE [Clostridia bacterium]